MNATLFAFGTTYLLHSTLLLACAWVLTRLPWPRALATKEWLWRGALVAGLVGAGLQTLGGVRTWSKAFALPAAVRSVADPEDGRSERAGALVLSPAASGATGERALALEAVRAPGLDEERAARRRVARTTPAPALDAASERRLVWLVLLATGLVWILLALRAERALGRRVPLTDGPWADELRTLAREAGLRRRVRLSVSRRIAVPVALGVLRPEICLSARALEELPPACIRPVLAHELAHLVRLDPLWLGLAHVLRTLFFLQPLQRVAAREITRLAELSADDWAGAHTGERLALARSLTQAAGWIRARRTESAPSSACAMVQRGGRLEERVRRLLEPPARAHARTRRWAAPSCAAALVLGAPLVLPAWSAPTKEAPPAQPPATSGAAEAATATWDAALRTASELRAQLTALEARIRRLPTPALEPARQAALLQRAHDLRAALAELEAVARGALAPAVQASDVPANPDPIRSRTIPDPHRAQR